MENASKALIIAGAILLAILLISLGIMVFTQAQETVNDTSLSQAEVTSFNSNYLKYEGKQSGTMVKSLFSDVIANNAKESNPDIAVTFATGSLTSATSGISTSKIDTTKQYTVVLGYGSDGRVNSVTISG